MWAHQALNGTHISSCKLPENFYMCTLFPLWKEFFALSCSIHTCTHIHICICMHSTQSPSKSSSSSALTTSHIIWSTNSIVVTKVAIQPPATFKIQLSDNSHPKWNTNVTLVMMMDVIDLELCGTLFLSSKIGN